MSDSFGTPWTVPPGSSVHGIFQARLLEWVAISPPQKGQNPHFLNWQVGFLPLSQQGSPYTYIDKIYNLLTINLRIQTKTFETFNF